MWSLVSNRCIEFLSDWEVVWNGESAHETASANMMIIMTTTMVPFSASDWNPSLTFKHFLPFVFPILFFFLSRSRMEQNTHTNIERIEGELCYIHTNEEKCRQFCVKRKLPFNNSQFYICSRFFLWHSFWDRLCVTKFVKQRIPFDHNRSLSWFRLHLA